MAPLGCKCTGQRGRKNSAPAPNDLQRVSLERVRESGRGGWSVERWRRPAVGRSAATRCCCEARPAGESSAPSSPAMPALRRPARRRQPRPRPTRRRPPPLLSSPPWSRASSSTGRRAAPGTRGASGTGPRACFCAAASSGASWSPWPARGAPLRNRRAGTRQPGGAGRGGGRAGRPAQQRRAPSLRCPPHGGPRRACARARRGALLMLLVAHEAAATLDGTGVSTKPDESARPAATQRARRPGIARCLEVAKNAGAPLRRSSVLLD